MKCFRKFPPGFLEEVALHITPRFYRDGDIVFNLGEIGKEMFIIMGG